MAEDNLGQTLDWDATIVDFEDGGGDFDPVKPGEYEFEVEGVERGQYNGGPKMGPCPMAKVRVRLLDAERKAVVFTNFYMNSKVAWRISDFFKSVGMRERDADSHVPLKCDWPGTIGRHGRCKVTTRTYNGKIYNEVERWLKPPVDDAPFVGPAPSYDMQVAAAKVQAVFPGTKVTSVPKAGEF